jgi:hypothetical protein
VAPGHPGPCSTRDPRGGRQPHQASGAGFRSGITLSLHPSASAIPNRSSSLGTVLARHRQAARRHRPASMPSCRGRGGVKAPYRRGDLLVKRRTLMKDRSSFQQSGAAAARPSPSRPRSANGRGRGNSGRTSTTASTSSRFTCRLCASGGRTFLWLADKMRPTPASLRKKLSLEAQQRLYAHRWPGNVRQLNHVFRRAIALGRDKTISSSDLFQEDMAAMPPLPSAAAATSLRDHLDGSERAYLVSVIQECDRGPWRSRPSPTAASLIGRVCQLSSSPFVSRPQQTSWCESRFSTQSARFFDRRCTH